MKICIARLRSNVNYVEPLSYVADPYYEMLSRFCNKHQDDIHFSFYNFGLNAKPKRNLDALKEADVIIIPSEAEFQYHIPGFIHTLDKKRSDEDVKEFYDAIPSKAKIIILRYDHKDTVDLYQKYTFPGIKNEMVSVNEDDFKGSIAVMRFHFITDYFNNMLLPQSFEKEHDFCYYGCDKSRDVGGGKSTDERKAIIKQIRKCEDLNTFYVGRFSGIETDMKFNKNMKLLLPHLTSSRSTLCFNWPEQTKAPTARYSEAIACKMVPLVWKEYDSDNRVVSLPWQRCTTVEEVKAKIVELRDPVFFEETYSTIRRDYVENKILNMDEYFEYFEQKILTLAICRLYLPT